MSRESRRTSGDEITLRRRRHLRQPRQHQRQHIGLTFLQGVRLKTTYKKATCSFLDQKIMSHKQRTSCQASGRWDLGKTLVLWNQRSWNYTIHISCSIADIPPPKSFHVDVTEDDWYRCQDRDQNVFVWINILEQKIKKLVKESFFSYCHMFRRVDRYLRTRKM